MQHDGTKKAFWMAALAMISCFASFSCGDTLSLLISAYGSLPSPSPSPQADRVVSLLRLAGVPVPVAGGMPVTSLETDQYSGIVGWSPNHAAFHANTVYSATISLSPKAGWTLAGVAANSFAVDGASGVSNGANSGIITAVFPSTSAATITALDIPGIAVPVTGGTPAASVDAEQYSGTVSWSPSPVGIFSGGTVYTATISLSPKVGWTLAGVSENSFKVAGATSVAHAAASGQVTASFPSTEVLAWSVAEASGISRFVSVKADAKGNVYAAGYINGMGSYGFGPGVSAAGTGSKNAVLVKYGAGGTALWARSSNGPEASFSSVTVDASGNAYAVGYITGTGNYSFGLVSAAGTSNSSNPVLVKYDPNGQALWAKSLTTGSGASCYLSVATDGSGNVYAAGYISGTGSFGFGTGVSVAGGSSSYNPILVKYGADGTALWALSQGTGSGASLFSSVAVDASGNAYAAGHINGMGACSFGSGVSAGGTASLENVILVKYDATGTALWARSVSAGAIGSSFTSVAVDVSGNVYAVGYIQGTGSYTFGSGVATAGASANAYNAVMVKYDSSGTALWAKNSSTGTMAAVFSSVAVDAAGNAYAAGHIDGTGSYGFGPDVSASGTYAGGSNVVLVGYGADGTALWARSLSVGTNASAFNAVSVDGSGNVHAAGFITGTGGYGFGLGVSVAGSCNADNVVLVKYLP